MTRLNSRVMAGALLAAAAACTTPTSATDLHVDGPPKVEQVMMTEEFTDLQGTIRTRPLSLAYGHHPDPAFAMDDGKVVTAVTDPAGQNIRVVMDHLLVGNYLEEIQCRAPVDATATGAAAGYARVPIGTTPDDIANCSGPQDLVFARCVGDHAVCINNTGKVQITNADQGGNPVMPGQPAGIEDFIPGPDGDGVPDTDLFINGSVRVKCKGVGGKTFEAPLALDTSYWQPSGNQQVPAHGGVGLLGPAIVLNMSLGLPTNSQCTIVFDPSVVDDQGLGVCAPPDGDPDQDCNPGDTSLISFGTAGLRLGKKGNSPGDGQTSVSTTQVITLQFTTSMDTTSMANNITITGNGVNVPFTVVPTGGSSPLQYQLVTVGSAAGTTLDAGKTYVITIEPTVTDFAGQPLGGNPITVTFTT
jgi:hypothetical protein